MLTRRDFVAGTAALALAAPAYARAPSRKAPNVLFIAVDDLNDWIEPLGGHGGVVTPNFNRLARHARMFTRAYAQAPVCQASRASTLFGVPSTESGVYTHRTADWMETKLGDKDRFKSIVRHFRNQGHETIGLGKVFHDGWRRRGERNAANDISAWDHFNFCDGEDDCRAPLEDGGERYVVGPITAATHEMEDVRRARWLCKTVLGQKRDKPFFAAFGLRKPHLPWSVPKRFFDLYPLESVDYPLGAIDVAHNTLGANRDVADLPPTALKMIRQFHNDHKEIISRGQWRQVVRSYLAAISFADHVLGEVLDGLYDGPNADDTYLVLWSDHGWQLGEKLAWRKLTLWERALRVPLFIGGPGIKPGVSDEVISNLDIYPTIADLATGRTPETCRGFSFANYLTKGAKTPREAAVSTWSLRQELHHSVRDRRHRLIQYRNGDAELYDHDVDPFEVTNLLWRPTPEARSIAARLRAHLPTDSVAAAI